MISTSLEKNATHRTMEMLVQGQEAVPQALPMPRLLLTPEEAAEVLCLSRATIYNMLDDGRLISVRLGRSRRIRRGDLEEFVAKLRPATQSGSVRHVQR